MTRLIGVGGSLMKRTRRAFSPKGAGDSLAGAVQPWQSYQPLFACTRLGLITGTPAEEGPSPDVAFGPASWEYPAVPADQSRSITCLSGYRLVHSHVSGADAQYMGDHPSR